MHTPAGCGLCRAVDRRFAGSAQLAVAQEPTPDQQSAIRSNCRSDFMANCSGVPRGGKEAMQCLKDNVAKLSSGCQQAVKAVMPAPAAKPPAPPVTAAPAAPAAPPSASYAGGASDSSTGGSRRCSGSGCAPRPPWRNRRLLSHQRRKRCRHSRQQSNRQHRQRKALRDLQRAHHRPPPPRLR